MREKITEPKHWRAGNPSGTARNNSWTTRRRTQEEAQLPAAAVDAALDAALDDGGSTSTANQPLDATDIISSLANQLQLLEKQREQIQHMLDQVQRS
ncbi:MAG: hypothetical protein ACR2NM_11100 [Bythopirellula sp.]